jgi:hypothetical protein
VSRATSTRAAYCFQGLQASLHARFTPLAPSLVVRFRIHPPRPTRRVREFHEWVGNIIVLRCTLSQAKCREKEREREREKERESEGGIPDGARGRGFGRKRYYFSQFAKQMLPIVRPPASPPCLCSTARKFIFLALVRFPRHRPTPVHRDILSPFVQRNEFFARGFMQS